MPTTPHLPAIPFRLPSRATVVATVVATLAVTLLAATLATWHGSVLTAAVPVIAFALGATLFLTVRRSLRRASALIDTILREELDRPEYPDQEARAESRAKQHTRH